MSETNTYVSEELDEYRMRTGGILRRVYGPPKVISSMNVRTVQPIKSLDEIRTTPDIRTVRTPIYTATRNAGEEAI